MDIRVSAYSPVTVTTSSNRVGSLTTVKNAQESGPVSAAAPIQMMRNNQALQEQKNFAVTEQRGTLVNILV